jgi:hypothetical protein
MWWQIKLYTYIINTRYSRITTWKDVSLKQPMNVQLRNSDMFTDGLITGKRLA